jgi:two-component sensor histidine kinase
MSSAPFFAFDTDEQANLLAKAIVATVREPLLVLDEHLRVVVASRSFYLTFEAAEHTTEGRKLYDLDDGTWDIAELRLLLEKIVPEHGVMEGFEVERDFPRIGERSMLLNARKVFYEGNGHTTILLGLEDVTERRRTERAMQALLEQQKMLLAEMSHRVANSLQIIASILLMKAKIVDSPETRMHLQDAHRRVMSIASVQHQLQPSEMGEKIAIGPYLSKLCETLGASMIGDNRPVLIKVAAGAGSMVSSEAVSLGLITTELLINAIKHAFPNVAKAGRIDVGYETNGDNWKLSISDNGVGMPDIRPSDKKSGLGTTLMKALAQQLDAKVEVASSPKGTTISITHAIFASNNLPAAA